MKIFNLFKTVCYRVAIATVILFGSYITSQSVYAETKTATVYTKFSDQEIINIAKEYYPKVEVELLEKGLICLTLDKGINIFIDNTREGESLSFFSYRTEEDVTLTKINQWNQEKRFLKLYKDKDGNLFLQADLYVEAGITKEYLGTFIKTVAIFINYLFYI